jgi:DNA gyrase subunit A
VDELHKIIIARLREYKKKFGRARLTQLDNLTKEKYVEEIKEEDIYVLIDRFGYVKSVDSASYSRLAEETLADYPHIVCMKNTDRLCVFTEEGNMYQVKAAAIPRGRSRDKGVLIQSLCKSSQETILLYISAEDLFESQLFFATKNGFVKQVAGISFDTNRSVISSTKLDEGDKIAGITPLSVMEVINPDEKVVLITKKGLSLGFPLYEVSELKKTSRGVKGITLDDGDTVRYASVVSPDCEELLFDQKKYDPKKIRNRKRAAKGQKAQIKK